MKIASIFLLGRSHRVGGGSSMQPRRPCGQVQATKI